MIAEVALRFALAIAFDALAFIVWDIGTRPPFQLARDLARGARRPACSRAGCCGCSPGCALLVAGFVVARPGFSTVRSFMLIQTGMLIAALIVESLIGTDLRARVRRAVPRP